jgi:hypothetical protein
MEKLNNNYFILSLTLTTIGTVLTTFKVGFYLDIVVLSSAVVIGVFGCSKDKAKAFG